MSHTLSPTTKLSVIGLPRASAAARNRRQVQDLERRARGRLAPARRDGPRHPRVGQHLEQVLRAGQRPDFAEAAAVAGFVALAELVRLGGCELTSCLADQGTQKQAAAHPDPAVDAPDREVDAGRRKRLFPGEHVLVDAVQQRAVEVEEHGGTVGVPDPTRRGVAHWLTHDSNPIRGRPGCAL